MRCSKPFFVAAVFAALAACADAPTGPAGPGTGARTRPGFAMDATTSRVVAYFPTWAGNVDSIQYGKLTHIIYAFALPTTTGGLTNVPMSGDARLTSLVNKAHAAGVKVLISVGGWNNTNDSIFAAMAASSTARASFVSNVATFIGNYGLDGVDIDWEFPDAGTAEAASFATLMDELGTAMHGSGKLLTAAVPATGYHGDGILSSVFDDVDFLILMAYARSTHPHSPFSYAVEALDYWSLRGLPKAKTVLGVPFYGKDASGANLPYRTLVRNDAQAPYADLSSGYHYNGVATMKQKTTLSLQRGSGVGIWELSNDTTLASISLLNAIQEAMNAPVPPYDYTKVVYDDALEGWADWSWNVSVSFASSSPVYQGSASIAATYTAAWGGVQLYYGGGVNPATVSTLELYVHGGTAGGQNLRVYLVDASGSLTKVPLNGYVAGGSVAAGTWRQVSIPLSAMGVTTSPFTRLVVQDAAGAPQPTFYLDRIRFVP